LAVVATTRDFSSRKVCTSAPCSIFFSSKRIVTYLPKRDELLLRTVFALPSPSRIGFDCRIRCESEPCAPPVSDARHTR